MVENNAKEKTEFEEEVPENPSVEEFYQSILETETEEAEEEIVKKVVGKSDLEKDEELAKMKDTVLRTMAEMENLRKRTEKEVVDAQKYAITSFAKDMIGVLENMRLAQNSIAEENLEENQPLKALSDGIALTANELLKAFEKYGIVRIDPMGEKFDHNFHQAMMEIESDEIPGTVVLVMQAGYTFKDRLLRPAMVGIAKAKPKIKADTENNSKDGA